MTRDLAGKRILITGASSGIGRALAIQFAKAGSRVALVARSADKLYDLAKSIGADALAIPADITVEADRIRMVDGVQKAFGGLDILVNNAGIASWALFPDSTPEIMRQIMEVNFFAPAELCRRFAPMLTKGNQAAIVNVASRCGRRALPGWSEYSSSKFALCGLTESLRAEYARFDIDVLLIIPGLTSSDFSKNFLLSKGRSGIQFDKGMTPDYVAERILKSVRKNKTETIIGNEARWVLLFNKFAPRLTDWLFARKIKQLWQEK